MLLLSNFIWKGLNKEKVIELETKSPDKNVVSYYLWHYSDMAKYLLSHKEDTVTIPKQKYNPRTKPPFIHGNSINILNGLLRGFNTDLDIARKLKISKRTADRIMHPKENYNDLNTINNTVTIHGFNDDLHYHWLRRKSKHTDKYHHWDWKLDMISLGKYKPILVVDNLTLRRYIWNQKSPIKNQIDDKYKRKPKGYILNRMVNQQKHNLFQQIRLKLVIKYLKKYRHQNIFSSFPNYLTYINRGCISYLYVAEKKLHDTSWTLPLRLTKDGQKLLSDPKLSHQLLQIDPNTKSLPLQYYDFDDSIKYTITSALLYLNLYYYQRYSLIPLHKQMLLHYIYNKLLNQIDPNPIFNNVNKLSKYVKPVQYKAWKLRKLLYTYINWHH